MLLSTCSYPIYLFVALSFFILLYKLTLSLVVGRYRFLNDANIMPIQGYNTHRPIYKK